jgi:hypothetical protein
MTQNISPIIVDLGKKRRKAVKALKRGGGKLLQEVTQAVDEIRTQLGTEAEGKELVPVVLIYQKKLRRKGGLWRGGF